MAGWSQEELAERLNVSRQSVSKWESAQSMPDIDKILQLSSLFSVTTDCLLKDTQDDPQPAAVQTPSPLPRVTLAQAEDYLTKAQPRRGAERWRRRSASSAPFRCWRWVQ
mgnify:CR=1 FL=1